MSDKFECGHDRYIGDDGICGLCAYNKVYESSTPSNDFYEDDEPVEDVLAVYNNTLSEAAQKLREELLKQSQVPVPEDPTKFLWHLDRLKKEHSTGIDKFVTYIGPAFDHDALFKLLVQSVCPVVCVGYVNETGWHEICEAKAHRAMKELGYE